MVQIEYEAKFDAIDTVDMRKKLKALGASIIRPEFTQKRITFHPPHTIEGGYLRVRDEAGKITMTLKIMEDHDSIERQKEVELVIDDFDAAVSMLTALGARKKAFQETRREIWKLGEVEIMFDTWPFLEPFIEIEGPSESAVQDVAEQLGLDWNDAIFGAVDELYSKVYNISKDRINNNTPKIIFDMENPFTR